MSEQWQEEAHKLFDHWKAEADAPDWSHERRGIMPTWQAFVPDVIRAMWPQMTKLQRYGVVAWAVEQAEDGFDPR